MKPRVSYNRTTGRWEASHAACGWWHNTQHYQLAQRLARGHVCPPPIPHGTRDTMRRLASRGLDAPPDVVLKLLNALDAYDVLVEFTRGHMMGADVLRGQLATATAERDRLAAAVDRVAALADQMDRDAVEIAASGNVWAMAYVNYTRIDADAIRRALDGSES